MSFFRVAAGVPACAVAHPKVNAERIIELAKSAHKGGVHVLAFPELCLTGYTARDLLTDTTLNQAVLDALETLVNASKNLDLVLIVGCPLESRHRLYNVAVVIQRGKVLGIVPKSFIPRSSEFEEARWFRSGRTLEEETLTLLGASVPFGTHLIFDAKGASFGVELCEDLWHSRPPSSEMFTEGALVMFNLSASNFLVGKAEERRLLVRASAKRGIGGYVYVAAGPTESSTDMAFDADAFIAEREEILAESRRFDRREQLVVSDIDLTSLSYERRRNQTFGDGRRHHVRTVSFTLPTMVWPPKRVFSRTPFVMGDSHEMARRNWEVFEIQSNALATRMQAIGKPKLVLGLSGGIDSTHAALVCVEALRICNQPASDLVCIGMPGFGSSQRTQNNSHALANALGTSLQTLSIAELSTQILKDVGHQLALDDDSAVEDVIQKLREIPELGDTSFENVQARMRTLLLMTMANQRGGIVVGTGDLSEKALGWSTYAGDQIAMYDVNAGVPKSLIQHVMRWVVEHRASRWGHQDPALLQEALLSVLDTPISPELLPPDLDGDVAQLTESVLGP